ncbi:MAG: 2-amino-4-hydroxy-6-hydroxymethyldihydropteridine diphosphokinase [Myxococcota bacterium]
MDGTPSADVREARVFVGLGGNIGDRLATLRSGARGLSDPAAGLEIVRASGIYETSPMGPSTGAFLNAVVELRTRWAADALMARLLEVEVKHGRQRTERWGARTLDLDLLVVLRAEGDRWANESRNTPGLTLPHEGIADRDFVLVPLLEVAGEDLLVRGQPARRWLEALEPKQRTILRRWDDDLLA